MYFVYLLSSLKVRRFYIGVTTEPGRRLIEHNAGSTKSTRPFRPWKMIYVEGPLEKAEAFKKEWFLKHPKGFKEKMELINRYGGVA